MSATHTYGGEHAPVTVYAEANWDPLHSPLAEIGVGAGRVALHPEVIAAMPDTEHINIADLNSTAFLAFGITNSETQTFFMPDSVISNLQIGAGKIRGALGYPRPRGLGQALYAHGIFENSKRGDFPNLDADERDLLEQLATNKKVEDVYKASALSRTDCIDLLDYLRRQTGIKRMSHLLIAAQVAEKIDITRYYELPPSLRDQPTL